MGTHSGPRRSDVFLKLLAKQIALIKYGYQEPIIKLGNLDSIELFKIHAMQ